MHLKFVVVQHLRSKVGEGIVVVDRRLWYGFAEGGGKTAGDWRAPDLRSYAFCVLQLASPVQEVRAERRNGSV